MYIHSYGYSKVSSISWDLAAYERAFCVDVVVQAKNILAKRRSKVFSVTASTSFKSACGSGHKNLACCGLPTEIVSHVDTRHHPDGGRICYVAYDLNICVFDVHALDRGWSQLKAM